MANKKKITGTILLVAFFIVCLGGSFYVSKFMLKVYPVIGASMEPNIHDGDDVLIFRTTEVRFGDVIVFESNDDDKYLIKRVIGLPGDKVAIKYNSQNDCYDVFRNGEQLSEEYIKEEISSISYRELSVIVPEGFIFYLGDNRNNSIDSHISGRYCEIERIEGRVFLRYTGLFDMKAVKRLK